jgi:hypothetical protein
MISIFSIFLLRDWKPSVKLQLSVDLQLVREQLPELKLFASALDFLEATGENCWLGLQWPVANATRDCFACEAVSSSSIAHKCSTQMNGTEKKNRKR